MGHLYYATSSFVHHFITINELKLGLQSGNAQFGWKSAIFLLASDLEIWRMTLKNNRAPLLCYFSLCASFHSHRWIQTGVTIRKRPISVKTGNFLSRVTLKFDGWPWKTIGHLSHMPHQALCIISSPYVNSNWSYGLETAKLGFWPLWPWHLTSGIDLLHGHRFCYC